MCKIVKKLKIAMLTTTFFPQVGGAEYQVKWLAEELAKRGHEVYLFTPYEANEFIEKNEKGFPKNISLRKKGANSFSDASRMIYRFAKAIKRIKPNVVHAHYAFSVGFLAVITKPIHKAPVVITSHEEDIRVIKEIGYGMRLKWYRRLLINLSLKWCDAHVVVSDTMKKDALESGSKEKKLQAIYNMYVPLNAEINDEYVKKVKEKYDIPIDNKIILSVSRLHKRKGLNYLIMSLKDVVTSDSNAHLVIVGDGSEKEGLKELVKRLSLEKLVTFTGFVDEMEKHALIKGCNVFCMPSVSEAFGISLFDPMFYGKSIVASDDEAIQEVLGSAGLIVQKRNPSSLSEGIISILNDEKLRDELAVKCKNRIKLFMPDKATSEYLKLYNKLRERS